MKRSGLLYGLGGILVVLAATWAGYVFLGSSRPVEHSPERAVGTETSGTDIVFYYGEECPHCHDVLDFLKENDIASKVPFVTKETWHIQANGKELFERADSCGIPRDEVGVPFLYADGKCHVGTPDVVGYFSEKTGISME